MSIKQIKKSINQSKELFNNITNTVYGSLVQSCLILLQKNWTEQQFINKMKKARFPYMEDKDFIRKTVEAVGLEYDEVDGLPLCVVESDWNTLILPYIVEEGQVIPMPINRDGILPQTVLKARSYHVVDWDNMNNKEE